MEIIYFHIFFIALIHLIPFFKKRNKSFDDWNGGRLKYETFVQLYICINLILLWFKLTLLIKLNSYLILVLSTIIFIGLIFILYLFKFYNNTKYQSIIKWIYLYLYKKSLLIEVLFILVCIIDILLGFALYRNEGLLGLMVYWYLWLLSRVLIFGNYIIHKFQWLFLAFCILMIQLIIYVCLY